MTRSNGKTHAALEASEKEVAGADYRREGDNDVDYSLLPSFDHNTKKEEPKRIFEDEHCEDVEYFCCYKPLRSCKLHLLRVR